MKKKGFTLVELLAVIVLISIITTLGTVGISAVKDQINEQMWQSTISLVEMGAINFGEDNLAIIKDKTNEDDYRCTEKDGDFCIQIPIQSLIERGYIATKERDQSDNHNKVLINNTLNASENDEENYQNGYYINNNCVKIYIDKDLVYAEYLNFKCVN